MAWEDCSAQRANELIQLGSSGKGCSAQRTKAVDLTLMARTNDSALVARADGSALMGKSKWLSFDGQGQMDVAWLGVSSSQVAPPHLGSTLNSFQVAPPPLGLALNSTH